MNIKKSIRNNKTLAPLVKVRDWIMRVTGLFKLKAIIKRKFYFARIRREDAELKKQVAKKICEMPTGLIDKQISNGEIVVSLTSYGHRVSDTLPYMLYSLLIQTKLPHKIAVYLDEDNWNDAILPPLLKEMQRIGVDFYYCEDLKSYKKLIPALQMFPDNPILVCDDDFYYHPKYMEWILEAYSNSDHKTVIGSLGKIPQKEKGGYLPYSVWKSDDVAEMSDSIAFGSGHGTLFPPYTFDDEIKNKDVFMKLCPTADDIWFWVMMQRQNVNRVLLMRHGYGLHRVVDRIEDFDFLNADNLTRINVVEGKNDLQLKALIDYYKL